MFRWKSGDRYIYIEEVRINTMKSIKVSDKVWERLWKLRIDWKLKTLDEVVATALKKSRKA